MKGIERDLDVFFLDGALPSPDDAACADNGRVEDAVTAGADAVAELFIEDNCAVTVTKHEFVKAGEEIDGAVGLLRFVGGVPIRLTVDFFFDEIGFDTY